jgi:DNA end-binding protein Ku
MARPLWTGSLSFGLVNVPVSLVTAVRDLDALERSLAELERSEGA